VQQLATLKSRPHTPTTSQALLEDLSLSLSLCVQISSLCFPFSVIAANAMPGICTRCQTCAWKNVVSAGNFTQISKAFLLMLLQKEKFLNVIGFSFLWENEGYSLMFSFTKYAKLQHFLCKKM
jgi:hypothetical protein